MSVSPVTGNTPTPPVVSPTSMKATAAAAAEEANETSATTKQEAAKGDQVAIRKLAREQRSHHAHKPKSAQESGKGELVDRKV